MEKREPTIQDKLNGEFAKSVVLIQSLYDDYVETMSELTDKSKEEIKKRIALKIKTNTETLTNTLKDFS
jgi:hypothetical protein